MNKIVVLSNRSKMNNTKKRYLFAMAMIAIFMILSPILVLKGFRGNTEKNGEKSFLKNSSNLYLYVGDTRVDYYTIKAEEILYCENITVDGKSYLCYYYFDKNEEPLIGWISNNDIIYDYTRRANK